jgi:DNA polymerase-3 subunit epsilon
VRDASFAVIDTETTGLDPSSDHVVSLAIVPVDAGRVRPEAAWQILIDPGVPVPPASTAIHGITDADVRGAPDLATALAIAGSAMRGRIIVGHNLPFDLAFLASVGYEAADQLDTLQVSRLLWRRRGTRHGLDALASRTAVVPQYRHSALGDAIATAQALVACLPLLAGRGLDTPAAVADAYRALQIRRARVRRSIRRRSIRRRPGAQPPRGRRRSARQRP